MNAKLVWGGGLTVLLALVIGMMFFPKSKTKKQVVPKSEPSGKKNKGSKKTLALSDTSHTDGKKSELVKRDTSEVKAETPREKAARIAADKDARAIAQKLRPLRPTTRDDLVSEFIKLKGEERLNHPAYKTFIARGGSDKELVNYKFKSRPPSTRPPVKTSLRKKDFVVIVHRGSGQTGRYANVDIELSLNKFPGPKDMILILRHDKSLKAESFFAHSMLQATKKKVTFQETGTPGESIIQINGSPDAMSYGKMLTLRFIVEGRDPSVTPIFIREISQLGVPSPNVGTVGSVMQIR